MISVLMPTRGRPHNMQELIESVIATANQAVEIVFYIDEDDELSQKHVWQYTQFTFMKVKAVVGPRIVMSATYNECASAATGEILMQCCDAVLFKTPDWDAMVEAEFLKVPDKILMVYGEDNIHHGAHAALPFVHRRWVEVLGRLVPPYFSCDWCDTWNFEIARGIGRTVYLPGLLTEHRHPCVGTAEVDKTHEERMARGQQDDVQSLYGRLFPERQADMYKLRDACWSPF